MMKKFLVFALTVLMAVISSQALPNLAYAGQWTLGDRIDYKCRKNTESRNIQYCHNCNLTLGTNSYVSWTFQTKCDSRVTRREVRGELKCINWPQEPEQRRLITQNAVSNLPPSSTPCP